MNAGANIRDRVTHIRRPKLVWVITIFYFVSAGWTLFAYVLCYSGLLPLNETQIAYFKSQTILDNFFGILTGLLNLLGAISLFLLRRTAFYLFLAGFIFGIVLTIYQIIFKNFLAVIDEPTLTGSIIACAISIAIIQYTNKLIKSKILN